MIDPLANSLPETAASGESSSPLDRVVDDYEPRLEALELTIQALQAGHSFDQTREHLIGIGWSESDADEIVEEGRLRTQETRGVLTRDRVLRDANRRARQGMWASAMQLIRALADFSLLRRMRRRTPNDTRSPD